jgi:hypothetical protein
MPEEIMIVQGKFTDEQGQHSVSVFEQVEDGEKTGKYRCLVDDTQKVYLDWVDDLWFEEGARTTRANRIGAMIAEYED